MSYTPASVSITGVQFEIFMDKVQLMVRALFVLENPEHFFDESEPMTLNEQLFSPPESPNSPWQINSLTLEDIQHIDPEEFFNTPPAPWQPVQHLFTDEDLLPTQELSDSSDLETEILFSDSTGDIDLTELFEN